MSPTLRSKRRVLSRTNGHCSLSKHRHRGNENEYPYMLINRRFEKSTESSRRSRPLHFYFFWSVSPPRLSSQKVSSRLFKPTSRSPPIFNIQCQSVLRVSFSVQYEERNKRIGAFIYGLSCGENWFEPRWIYFLLHIVSP